MNTDEGLLPSELRRHILEYASPWKDIFKRSVCPEIEQPYLGHWFCTLQPPQRLQPEIAVDFGDYF